MTSFYVACVDDSKSCYYGNYNSIGIGSNSFSLYSNGKKLEKVISFDDIELVAFTPNSTDKAFTTYTNYTELLKFSMFFIEKNTVKQLSIFD